MKLARIYLNTDDRRRIVIEPAGGWHVEEFIDLPTKEYPRGSWHIATDPMTDQECADVLSQAYAVVATALSQWEGAMDNGEQTDIEYPAGELFAG